MKLLAGAASLLALTLFLSPVMAQDSAVVVDQPAAEQPVAEQPAQDAQQAAPEVPAEILALLGDTRAASELSDGELQSRAKAARRFAKDKNLPEDIRSQLVAMFEASRAEMDARKQADKKPEKPAQQEQQAEPAPAPQPEQQAAPAAPVAQPEQQAAPAEPAPAVAAEQAPAAAAEPAIPEEVTNLLNDGRALADIGSDELKTRAKAARRFAKDEKLPQDVRDKLNSMAQDMRIEMTKRDQPQTEQQATPAPAPKPEPVTPEVAPPKEAVVAVPVEPPPPVAEPAPKPEVAVAPPPAPAAADVKQLDSNAGDPASEKQARAYLDDTTDITTLSDDALRTRLDGIRELMATNELTRDTERAVRKKLRVERAVLRERVAKIEIAKQQAAQQAQQQAGAQPAPQPVPAPKPGQKPVPVQPKPSKDFNISVNIITNLTPPIDVLRDRRRSDELELSELQRRIEVYNDAQYDDGYDQQNRDYWHASVQHDRELLRRRMIEERHRREAQLAMEASDESLDIEIDAAPRPNRPRPQRDVFAAEVDDAELEDVLVAPPRKSFKQRYTVDEIAVQPKLRETVSRIEIDTIRFGFNESFIREEQVGNLDGIGAIIERIVKKYPNEVFMIEGHTDAVGSDAYNNVLSKQRAEAVKRALSAYYVIPARNLRTVGLGERFLKIPTADQEPENRRVSISRITQLLSAE